MLYINCEYKLIINNYKFRLKRLIDLQSLFVQSIHIHINPLRLKNSIDNRLERATIVRQDAFISPALIIVRRKIHR